ncbi:hypothetical protein [Bradyrhizobium sp. CCGUVB14]|uniref:hypothetical protein n=1 Tax=Bradyrhizobium sp. CCGUVB14 TaxID=2949628 RepID=UPI0020B20D85|nr:hypothetical protein [Bradyrhizobium sp. CCGUVB14]MCP3447328.1 hypothetical protein [Bradyrhizobium sp. CCGUVB14]
MDSEITRRMILVGTAAVAVSGLVRPTFVIASTAPLPRPAPWPVDLNGLFGEYLSSIFRVEVRKDCLVWHGAPRGDDFLGPEGYRISPELRNELADCLLFGDVIYFVEETEQEFGALEKKVTRVIPWKSPTPESFAAAYLQGN